MLFFKYCTKRYGLELIKDLLFIIIAQGATKLGPIKVRNSSASDGKPKFLRIELDWSICISQKCITQYTVF